MLRDWVWNDLSNTRAVIEQDMVDDCLLKYYSVQLQIDTESTYSAVNTEWLWEHLQ